MLFIFKIRELNKLLQQQSNVRTHTILEQTSVPSPAFLNNRTILPFSGLPSQWTSCFLDPCRTITRVHRRSPQLPAWCLHRPLHGRLLCSDWRCLVGKASPAPLRWQVPGLGLRGHLGTSSLLAHSLRSLGAGPLHHSDLNSHPHPQLPGSRWAPTSQPTPQQLDRPTACQTRLRTARWPQGTARERVVSAGEPWCPFLGESH